MGGTASQPWHSRSKLAWSVDLKRLWELTAKYPQRKVSVSSLDFILDWPVWADAAGADITPRNVMKLRDDVYRQHAAQIENANLKYPLLIQVDSQNKPRDVLDGIHRLLRAKQLGYSTVQCVVVTESDLQKCQPDRAGWCIW